jgi:hypothetical protein
VCEVRRDGARDGASVSGGGAARRAQGVARAAVRGDAAVMRENGERYYCASIARARGAHGRSRAAHMGAACVRAVRDRPMRSVRRGIHRRSRGVG